MFTLAICNTPNVKVCKDNRLVNNPRDSGGCRFRPLRFILREDITVMLVIVLKSC